MGGPPRAVAVVRHAVRAGLRASPSPVLAACSGGADSVALAAALAFEARSAGVRVGGVTVDQGLPVWDDPWNTDPALTRARLRAEVLPLLEEVLGGGVAPALARTAAQLREDLDALDAMADDALARLAGESAGGGLPADPLGALPPALRRRGPRRGGPRGAGG